MRHFGFLRGANVDFHIARATHALAGGRERGTPVGGKRKLSFPATRPGAGRQLASEQRRHEPGGGGRASLSVGKSAQPNSSLTVPLFLPAIFCGPQSATTPTAL